MSCRLIFLTEYRIENRISMIILSPAEKKKIIEKGIQYWNLQCKTENALVSTKLEWQFDMKSLSMKIKREWKKQRKRQRLKYQVPMSNKIERWMRNIIAWNLYGNKWLFECYWTYCTPSGVPSNDQKKALDDKTIRCWHQTMLHFCIFRITLTSKIRNAIENATKRIWLAVQNGAFEWLNAIWLQKCPTFFLLIIA